MISCNRLCYSINDNVYWMTSRSGSTDIIVLIFTNYEKISAKTDCVDHARKRQRKKMRGEAAKESLLSCEKIPFASNESRISS